MLRAVRIKEQRFTPQSLRSRPTETAWNKFTRFGRAYSEPDPPLLGVCVAKAGEKRDSRSEISWKHHDAENLLLPSRMLILAAGIGRASRRDEWIWAAPLGVKVNSACVCSGRWKREKAARSFGVCCAAGRLEENECLVTVMLCSDYGRLELQSSSYIHSHVEQI